MLCKRIIACLDIKDGRTVKGTRFVDLRDAGDPVELAAHYANESVDELVFLDITASTEKRKILTDLVKRVASRINIPFTVGGGINELDDVYHLLSSGADKISVNTAAVKNPELISELAREFGSQCVVVAIDARKEEDGEWYVYLYGGKKNAHIRCFEWAKEVVDRGAGEILLTSMDHDGTRNGFAVDLTALLSKNLPIPVIASGGAGNVNHFEEVFRAGADAALAAGIFHFKDVQIHELKRELKSKGIEVRI